MSRDHTPAPRTPEITLEQDRPTLEPPADQHHLYRPGVGIVLFNRQGSVFVCERLDNPGAWQMPQGGIDEGEKAYPAALRELREETSITSVEKLGETLHPVAAFRTRSQR